MKYHILLTGATGLLGRYLLRDLLSANVSVVALVRSTRKQSAAERVELLMRSWEHMLGRDLPRPVVLEGDISQSNLGLDDASVEWVAENCDAMLHNAASLVFQSTDSKSEPWRSNVAGMQNVLDLCQKTGIRDFHDVSTAYVCGLRNGTVLESELDVGQELGNDYERSKVQAEKLVLSADFLAPPTIYRPSIIVGDSSTGFTTTFHGFYAALQLAKTLVEAQRAKGAHVVNADTIRLTLDGNESMNFVPVDWVSAVMIHIVTSPEHHGKTYHLTPSQPVTSRTVHDVLQESLDFGTASFDGPGKLEDPTEVERLFYEHIRVYDSYWRDDPIFDRTNTLRAAPHLPCPAVNKEMLLRLALAAVDMNFRWKDGSTSQPSQISS